MRETLKVNQHFCTNTNFFSLNYYNPRTALIDHWKGMINSDQGVVYEVLYVF